MIRSFRIIIYFYSYYSNFEKRKEIYKIDSKLLINDIYIYIFYQEKRNDFNSSLVADADFLWYFIASNEIVR